MIRAVAFDVGVTHLGVALAHVDASTGTLTVQRIWCIDTKVFRHRRVPLHACTLPHRNMACDRIRHVLQELHDEISATSVALVEQQPPRGLVDVEQMLVRELGDERVIMVSPRSMHAALGFPKTGDYEARKCFSVALARPHLHATALEEMDALERQHDVSDAVCMLLFYAQRFKTRALPASGRVLHHAPDATHACNPFERWRRPSPH